MNRGHTTVLMLAFFFLATGSKAQKQINIDYGVISDTVKNLLGGNRGKSFDPETIQILHDEGIKYIRTHDFHGILDYSDYSDFWNSDGLGHDTINQDFDPQCPDDYHWEWADSIVNMIINNSFEVFFRLGVSYPNPDIYPLSPTSPPCDSPETPYHFTRFASLAKQTYRHYCEGWSNGYAYAIRYWEVWNEPGGVFWKGSVNQFYSMYKAVADSLKNYAPDIKLGAPGALPETARGENRQYREDLIASCAAYGVPLDFYSWHLYGAKNPYGIKAYADTIRTILNANGFFQSENIISEINNTLGSALDTFAMSPYGAAYYLSIILTAQVAPVDKLLWYPSGVGIVDNNYTRTNVGMTFFHTLQENTPLVIPNDGNEVVEGKESSYENNFMVLSSKSSDSSKVSVLISNLQSDNTLINLRLENSPWSDEDSLKITRHMVSDQYVHYVGEEYIPGSPTLVLENQSCPNPGILFIEIEKIENNTGIKEPKNREVNIFPNPTTGRIRITNVAGLAIEVLDPLGRRVFHRAENQEEQVSLDFSGKMRGVYLVKCYRRASGWQYIKKIVVL